MRTTRALLAAAAIMLTTAGCGMLPSVASQPAEQTEQSEQPARQMPDTPATDGAQDQPAAVPAAPAERAPVGQTDDSILSFGQTATWSGGLDVTVDKPRPADLSDISRQVNDVGADEKVAAVDIRVVNNSQQAVEARDLATRATSGSKMTKSVYDPDVGLLSGRILPGGSLEWTVLFTQPGDSLEVTVEWMGGDPAPVTFR